MSIVSHKWGRVFLEEAGGDGDPCGGGAPAELTLEQVLGAAPEELRTEFGQVLADVKDIPGLLKTTVNAQRMLGGSIRIPSEDAPEDVKAKFYEKLAGVPGVAITSDESSLRKSLGVPENPGDYKVDLSSLPEEISIDQAEMDARLKHWHELGLSQAQVEREVQAWVADEQRGLEDWKNQNIEAEKALKAKYGAAYEEKMDRVNYVTNHVLSKEDVEYLRNTGALTKPGIVDMLATLGDQLQDNGTIEAARRSRQAYTPDEAKERIADLESSAAYLDPYHPDHANLVQKRQKLYEMAYPSS
jgi:hypothetical protein